MAKYNLGLIFYPQPDGRYAVVCPEIENCFSEGNTVEEATTRIRELIVDMLPDEIKNANDEQLFREGFCMKGKMFQEIEVEMTESKEVDLPALTKIERAAV